MSHRWLTVALLAAAIAIPARALGGDDPSADTFRRAELAERALGELERAAQLYRDAARGAATSEARATADVRAASCLRRLGRVDEARALLTQWVARREDVSETVRRAAEAEVAACATTAGAALPTPMPPTDGGATSRMAEKDRELEQALQDLETELAQKKGFQVQAAELAQRLREKEAENARLRAEAAPPAPTTADEVLALRKREIERQRSDARRIARTFLTAARVLYQEGRFAEARRFLYDALERDPDDADAKALLARVAAPLGDREALFQRAIELAALAREVRAAGRAAEVSHLVEDARRLQERADFVASSAPLETALATIDAAPDLVRGGADLRRDVVRMLDAAASRGVPRKPAPPPAVDASGDRWAAALQDLLADAGREVAQGLELRFHDLGAVVSTGGLPPVPYGPDPSGWTISTADVEGAPLLAAWLRAAEARSFATPGATFSLVGSTCAALADMQTHRRIAERLSTLRVGSTAASDVRIIAYRIDASAVDEALGARGIMPVQAAGGARFATLDPADLDALLDVVPRVATGALGAASLRATPLRPFRLTAGPATSQLTVETITVPGTRLGIGLRAAVAWTPPERNGGPALRFDALAAGAVAPGGGVVVFGIPDPDRPGSDVAIVVRLGSAPEAAGGAPLPPPAPPEHAADVLRLPAVVAQVEDAPAPPLLVPEHPVPSREDALLRRLRLAAPRAQMVELKGDRVLVVGPDAGLVAVKALLAQFESVKGITRFDVRFHAVQQRTMDDIVKLCPRQFPAASGAFQWTVLGAGAESRAADLLLRSANGEIAQRDSIVAAPPTARGDAARIVRTPSRSGPGTIDGGAAWGRGESSWIEEGIVVSLRSFGRRTDGRVDLDLAARARWVADIGRRETETPLGRVPVSDPRTASWWGDVATPLGRGEVLLISGARDPFAAADSGRIVVTVRLAE